MQGIYRIRNKLDDKRYIGSAQDFDERWEGHKKELQKGIHYNSYLQNAWNKHGEENFAFEIEEEVKGSRNDAFDREQEYLDKWFPTGLLYNISFGANGGAVQGTGWHHTEETKQENREWHVEYYESHDVWNKGKECPQLAGENNGFYGKFHTEETKQENRECHVEYYKTHVNPFKGKHHTDKTKAEHGKFMKEWYRCHEHQNAIDHPAFYNVQAKTFAPAGRNLSKLLREYGLTYYVFRSLITGKIKCSKDGWRIANEEEIAQLLDKKAGSQKS